MGFCSSSGRPGSGVEGLEPCSGARVSSSNSRVARVGIHVLGSGV